MTPDKFIENVLRTESTKFYIPTYARRLLHSSMGCCTESAEFLDALKKCLFYAKPVDFTNVKEELGDILWYIAIACSELNCTFEQLMEINIEKLKARYPDRFSSDKAINRNLPLERLILEVGNAKEIAQEGTTFEDPS